LQVLAGVEVFCRGSSCGRHRLRGAGQRLAGGAIKAEAALAVQPLLKSPVRQPRQSLPMKHLPGLDLLRAVAIVWVMLFHSFLVGGLGADFAWLSRFGWAGVDIFFVLSGFLIGSQLLQQLERSGTLSLGGFYARRAWRILPAFAVVLAMYVFFPALREVPGLQPWWQFASFTMNLLIDYERNPAFSHAWSLCVEEHFYLVFPLLALGLSRRASVPRFLAICAAVLLLGIALRGAAWLHFAAIDPPRNWFIEEIYYPCGSHRRCRACAFRFSSRTRWRYCLPARCCTTWSSARSCAGAIGD